MSVFDEINGGVMEATPVADGFTKATPDQWRKMSPEQRQTYLKSAKANEEKPKSGSIFDEINGGQPQVAKPSAPVDPHATPDAPTWVGRRIQDVIGKQDERFKDVPAFRPDTAGFDGVGKGTYAAGVIAGNSDDGMADLIAKQLGPRHIKTEKDGNGYPVVHYYDDQGKSQKAYVNRPGLDIQDVARTIGGAVPYVVTGGMAGAAVKGAGLGVNALVQGATAGATNLAAQGTRGATGSDQSFDPAEAAITASAGVAAPVVGAAAGALWRRFVTVPGLVDSTTGQLTQKGLDAAKRAGLDPNEITPDVAKKFADVLSRTRDEAQAGVQATTSPFNIPVSKGQATKDPYLLTQEEAMRRRLFGEQAQGVMTDFDKQQTQAIKSAALGDTSQPGARSSIATELNPGRAVGDVNPGTLGGSIREGLQSAQEAARTAEKEAWKNTRLDATPPALDLLGPKISDAIKSSGIAPSQAGTPATHAMGELLDSFIAGEAPIASSAKVFGTPSMTTNVGEMRKQLLAKMQDAATPTDKSAARNVYNAFNEWIGEAADKALLSGDAGAAAQLTVARAFTRDMHAIFDPKNSAGRTTPAGNRLAQVLEGADTPEAVVGALFGSQGSKTMANGGVGALQNIKQALTQYAEPEVAKQTWNDIRLAYWVRLVQGKNGELVGPTAMLNNIKTSFAQQQSALETLYSPKEIVQMRQFVRALEAVSYKPPNASGSGYTAVGLAKDMVGKFFEAFGLNSKIAQSTIEYSGIGNAYGGASARAAVSPSVRNINPNLAGPVVGSTNALARD